ncbi:MAG: 3-oxoacyl-[acyl-carrier-protein] reductase FabG [Alphaproteobacteria bacterium MarineAlpha9_Bin5]|nr:MAG: 3-oxoacyl-[acyl-carrier-protein] reductase FabG [Alphaproteobacteria bacterium MarineAlpha9_Bin6]PPR39916.1 MAG: 3-oxoacyl-[acyl-carrier-protein] reductase FabG [Alphaproteobacteria bacterium MarineAlpha9_Bin5]
MVDAEFQGRVALVTGGSRGIGRAICERLASGGARIAINYQHNEDAAFATLGAINAAGSEAIMVQANVAEPDQVTAMVEQTERDLGTIDLLVTSAGIAKAEPPDQLDYASFKQIMSVNVDGTYLPLVSVTKGMRARRFGRIVCIASIAALRPRPAQAAYGASKAAVIAFARNLSEDLAPEVRINSIAPGLIETDMIQEMAPSQRQAMIDATPMKRLGRAEEIAELAAFLLSERSSFTTGQCYIASGGRVTLP